MQYGFRLALAGAMCALCVVSCSKKAEPAPSGEPIKAKQIEPMSVTGPAPDSMRKRAQTQATTAQPKKEKKSPEEAAAAKAERQKKRAEKKAAKEAAMMQEMKEGEAKMVTPPDQDAAMPSEPVTETPAPATTTT